MGYMCHHAIIVTTWKKEHIESAFKKAKLLFDERVTDIIMGVCNEYYTFLIGPDGSKEGWEESNTGDSLRDEFCHWVVDNNLYLTVSVVQYGDDGGDNNIRMVEGMES